MSYKPLVSIIMPAYNVEEYISESIESVVKQTYSNWELIIINDYSSDKTEEIIDLYLKKEKRIRKINLQSNVGPAKARNIGIKNSMGRFIAFLDSDDMWKNNKLSIQVKYMLDNDFSFTYTAYETIGGRKRKCFFVPEEIDYYGFLHNTCIGNLTVMIDRNSIKEFCIQYGTLEDTRTWLYILKQGITAHGLNLVLATYRVRKSSLSSNKFLNAIRHWECIRCQKELSTFYLIECELSYIFNAIKKRIV